MATTSGPGTMGRSAKAASSSSAATCRRRRSGKAFRAASPDESVTDRDNIASVAERMRPVTAGAAVVDVRMLGSTAVFVLGEEILLLVAKDGTQSRVAVHA